MTHLPELAAEGILLGLTGCPENRIQTKEDFELALNEDAMRIEAIVGQVSDKLLAGDCTAQAKERYDRDAQQFTRKSANGHRIECGRGDFDYHLNGFTPYGPCDFTVVNDEGYVLRFSTDERTVHSKKSGAPFTDERSLNCAVDEGGMACGEKTAGMKNPVFHYNTGEYSPANSVAVRDASAACKKLQSQLDPPQTN